MKSIIVFYTPFPDKINVQTKDEQSLIPIIRSDQILSDLKGTELNEEFHVVLIQDPIREKVETEVFFNPYQK